jgi:hypothetical protein
MARGFSYETFAAEVGTHRVTMYDWEKRYPEWVEAKRTGYEKALAFWENLLVSKAFGQKKEADIAAIIFCLKTRFHKHYGEKQKIDHTSSDGTMSPTEIKIVAG